jgi:hypothetical protein
MTWKTIILSVVLCLCETCFLVLKDLHFVFKDNIVRKMFIEKDDMIRLGSKRAKLFQEDLSLFCLKIHHVP